jgi:small subunit ribosomal protein S9
MAVMDWTWATGRRKEATAQVRIRPGSGRILVNRKEYAEYFTTDVCAVLSSNPFRLPTRWKSTTSSSP